MNIIRAILFFSIFLSIYSGMHYYVYKNLLVIFNYPLFLRFLVIIMGLLFPAIRILLVWKDFCVGSFLALIAALWLGIVFILTTWFFFAYILEKILGIMDLTHSISRIHLNTGVAVILIPMLILGLFSALKKPAVVKYTIDRSARYKKNRSVRIVQISDLHIGME
ncbi:MAG: hypothetical protein ABIA63_15105, partial [bacterium]